MNRKFFESIIYENARIPEHSDHSGNETRTSEEETPAHPTNEFSHPIRSDCIGSYFPICCRRLPPADSLSVIDNGLTQSDAESRRNDGSD